MGGRGRGLSITKVTHEILDPIHVFVRLDADERRVLDSRPFQRLRHVRQLGLTELVYPGGTHKRFEHSLGVMELASRVFKVVTRTDNVRDEARDLLPEIADQDKTTYWRRVLRMAALCHDLGHLPFSHTAENALLPEGWDHERLTREIVLSDEMKPIWEGLTVRPRPEEIVKLAVGPRKAKDLEFTRWEQILSEIIVGDALGVDRMDYLLRDAHHTGIASGRFDHHRLADTLRIVVAPSTDRAAGQGEPTLGIEDGGIHSAEALLIARYFMYSQVYFHPVRRIYDLHLKEFLADWLREGRFSTEVDRHLRMTDNDVAAAVWAASADTAAPGHVSARRITSREHFRLLYSPSRQEMKQRPEVGHAVFEALSQHFGAEHLRHDVYTEREGVLDFPVVGSTTGEVAWASSISDVLRTLPVVKVDYVYIHPSERQEAEAWLEQNRQRVIDSTPEAQQ